MPRLSQAAMFERTISQLLTKRRKYAEGLAQIDALFAKYHIQVTNGATAAAPAAAPATATRSTTAASNPASKSRTRRTLSQTADELILSMLKGKPMITGEINATWKRAGRGGTADNTLGRLVKAKQIKRAPVKDGRGSSYALA